MTILCWRHRDISDNLKMVTNLGWWRHSDEIFHLLAVLRCWWPDVGDKLKLMTILRHWWQGFDLDKNNRTLVPVCRARDLRCWWQKRLQLSSMSQNLLITFCFFRIRTRPLQTLLQRKMQSCCRLLQRKHLAWVTLQVATFCH